jgi:WD40 repeat protein
MISDGARPRGMSMRKNTVTDAAESHRSGDPLPLSLTASNLASAAGAPLPVAQASVAARRSSKTTTTLMTVSSCLAAPCCAESTEPGASPRDGGFPTRERTLSDLSAHTSSHKRSSGVPVSFLRSSICVSEDHLSGQLFAAIPELKLLVSCGHWDHSFRITHIESGKQVHTVNQHSDVVTCASYARDVATMWLATGSRDCTIMIWEVNPDYIPTNTHSSAVRDAPTTQNNYISHSPLKSQPLHILFGHDDAVTSVSINPEFDIVVSGSDDGTVMVHSLNSGVYIRSIVVSAVNVFGIGAAGITNNAGTLPSKPASVTTPPCAIVSPPKPTAQTPASHLIGSATPVASVVDSEGAGPDGAEESAIMALSTEVKVATPSDAANTIIAGATAVADSTAINTQANANIQAAFGGATVSTSHRKVTWVGISREGFVVIYCADDQLLLSYAINGDLLAIKVLPERLYAFTISEDGKVLITGGDSCLVVLRWVRAMLVFAVHLCSNVNFTDSVFGIS